MSISREAVLTAVERSPAAAAAHDRDGWVGLFTADGRVEDPVGSRPHLGLAGIGRFYDTFIGPRDITFHRDADIVTGRTVLRDLVLEVSMGRRVTMRIPAILRYDVAPSGVQITALRAYWELPTMAWQFARNGLSAIPVAMALTTALLRNQGPAGAAGFMAGVPGAGVRGKRAVTELLTEAGRGDEMAVKRRLGHGLVITLGDTEPLSQPGLIALLSGTHVRTVLVAGREVAARVSGPVGDVILIAEVAGRPATVRRLRVFAEHA